MRDQKTYAVAVAWQLTPSTIAAEAIAVIASDAAKATENGRRYATDKVPGAVAAVSILEIPPEILPDRLELLAEVARLLQENDALREDVRHYQQLLSGQRSEPAVGSTRTAVP